MHPESNSGTELSRHRILATIAGLGALYQLLFAGRFLTWFGIFFPVVQHQAVSLLFVLILIFFPATQRRGLAFWGDITLLVAGLIGVGYVAFNYEAVLNYGLYGYLDVQGMVLALLAAISVLEMARRKTGWALPLIIVTFVLLTVFQNHLPGLLYGRGFSLDRLTYSFYVGAAGIFGTPLRVAVTILITFIIFGRLLEASGAGQWFIRLTMLLTGWTAGGPAKAAVAASGFLGMISGSPSANVATTGAVTIPLMIRMGYPARFAGAVEAAASTGGQFMPPIMGSVAFIMAEWLGVPYIQIVKMALIPALLYFVVLFMSVHFEARKRGLQPVPAAELPRLKDVLGEGWFYLVPIGSLLYFLLMRGYPPEMSALLSIPLLIGVSFLAPDRDHHMVPKRIWEALVGGMQSWLTIASVTAAVGILIGTLELSGLGIKFSGFILQLSAGNILATVILVGAASFVLGMGLDSIPAYMTLTVLAAPALLELGIPIETAHLFVLYWGLASFITPPTCLAVYVACGISGSDVWETALQAVQVGIAAFLVPFAFILNPALLAKGTVNEILLGAATAIVGTTLVAASIRGFALKNLNWAQRVLLFAAGLCLIGPGTWTVVAAVVLVLAALLPASFR